MKEQSKSLQKSSVRECFAPPLAYITPGGSCLCIRFQYFQICHVDFHILRRMVLTRGPDKGPFHVFWCEKRSELIL